MPGRRHVLVVTGTRAEYGLLRSSMEELERRNGIRLSIVATGMHLSSQYGYTLKDIENDGFEVDRTVEMLLDGDTGRSMSKSLGIGLVSLSETMHELAPDIVLVLGDRNEAFAAGVAAAQQNIPVAHIHGGDAMRGALIDDSIRHALTKFAHLHFPATEASAERIRRMGEEEWRITAVGAPGLDDIIDENYDSPKPVFEDLGLDLGRPTVVLVQHPLTTAPEKAGGQMRATLDAVASFDCNAVVIYPNADAGGRDMIQVLESHPDVDGFTIVQNLPREKYLGLLALADVLVGNSSSGIIEAPTLGLPVVDIGPRQESRERSDNVTTVAHDTGEITAAIRKCLFDDTVQQRAEQCESPYDFGGAAKNIVDRLQDIELTNDLLRKQLTY